MSSIKFACHKNRLLAIFYRRSHRSRASAQIGGLVNAGAAKREGGSPPAAISSAALDSRRWSLDLLLRPLLKCQELMPDPLDPRN